MLTGSGRDVHSVYIDGRLVMADRVIPGVDLAADSARAQRQFEGLMSKYPDRTVGHPPVSDIFSSAYRILEGSSS